MIKKFGTKHCTRLVQQVSLYNCTYHLDATLCYIRLSEFLDWPDKMRENVRVYVC